MIGVFDSGVGGLCAVYELKHLLPRQNIVYLADRKNAPYGTKSRDELIALTKNDVRILKDMGADKILIACCTASTVHSFLDKEDRELSIPIITPAARIASGYKRVTVIATEHTVMSRAFRREIAALSHTAVQEIAAQELVSIVEGGFKNKRNSEKYSHVLNKIVNSAVDFGSDALILGCTHFSHLEKEFSNALPNMAIISPAREGARLLAECTEFKEENGKITYM